MIPYPPSSIAAAGVISERDAGDQQHVGVRGALTGAD